MTKSIIQEEKECYVCGVKNGLHLHHTIFGKNRSKSDADGLVVYLCYEHHKGTTGVHGKLGHELDVMLKDVSQRCWQKYYNKTEEDFIERYGRNYLK